MKGELRLDLRDRATVPAASGATAIVPGRPDQSELVRRLEAVDEDEQMPPPDSHKSLSEEEKDMLRRWIAEGAVYKDHWSFLPPVASEAPAVDDAAWSAQDIDRFVLRVLARNGLRPSPEADRATLVRRVSLDLRGKQPTSNEITTFTADKAADKRSKVIDAYLASDDYIDVRTLRMGDLLRIHPERMGGNFTGQRSAALFSEWIRDAIAENRPYNEIVQQIIIARGSTLQVGPANFYKIDRAPEDRMETVAQAFLGQRMACARCGATPVSSCSSWA